MRLDPTNTHTKWCLGNGEWAMELVWRPEDFESPICFVWLTKQRRNNYSVAESSFAVNSHASPEQETLTCCLGCWSAGLTLMDDGERFVRMETNGA